MPAASELGVRLAERHDAAVVVWISSGDDGPALWVYDRQTDRILARGLATPPPYDAPTAAAIALTLKTLLHHSAAAPEEVRAVVPSPAPPSRFVHLEIAVGVLALHTDPIDAEPRVGLAIALHPVELGGALGFALGVRTGTGLEVHQGATHGHWTDTWLTLGLRLRLDLDPIDLGLALDAGVVVTTLDAALAPETRAMVVLADFGADALGEIGVHVDAGLRFALRAGATFLVPQRRYLVRGTPVLTLSPVGLVGQLVCEVAW